jgi:uncharacterized membrane protein
MLLWTAILSLAPGLLAPLLTLLPTLKVRRRLQLYMVVRLVLTTLGCVMYLRDAVTWAPLYLTGLVGAAGVFNAGMWLGASAGAVRSAWRWALCNEFAIAGILASASLAKFVPLFFASG